MTDSIVTATIEERGRVYGDPQCSMTNIGLSWTALLQQHYGIPFSHPIPDFIVAQMMVCFKMQRAARVYKDDNYIDAHAYARFADSFQKVTARESSGEIGSKDSQIGEPASAGHGGLPRAGKDCVLLGEETP
jgi:hypothetical protein